MGSKCRIWRIWCISILIAFPAARLSADTVGADKSIITSCIKHVAHILTASDKSLEPAIAYGQELEQFETKDIDSLTIYNVTYWEAFFNTSSTEPSVPLSRALLLLRNSFFQKSVYNLGFTQFRTTDENHATVDEFKKMVAERIHAPEDCIKKGIECYNQHDTTNAMTWYRKALDIHHKSPSALYQIGIIEITGHWGIRVRKDSTLVIRPPKNVSMADLQNGFSYFELVRDYDPFFLFAYQGDQQLARQFGIVKDIRALLPSMLNGSMQPRTMINFGDLLFKLKQYEYAVYAYSIALYGSFDGRFDKNIVNKITRALDALGVHDAGTFLKQQVQGFTNAKRLW